MHRLSATRQAAPAPGSRPQQQDEVRAAKDQVHKEPRSGTPAARGCGGPHAASAQSNLIVSGGNLEVCSGRPSGVLLSQQFTCSAQYVFRTNGKQSGLRVRKASVIAAAEWAAEDSESGSKRSIAARVGGPVDAYYWPAQGAGQMERTSVAGNAQGDAAREGDELFERSCKRDGRAAGSLHNYIG